MPGIAYYLSTFYKRDELALRMGIFGKFLHAKYLAQRSNEGYLVSAASMAGAFSGLLATAFLSIPQLQGL